MEKKRGTMYIVLAAGEHWKTVTPEGSTGISCSLKWIGIAYAKLVDLVGRENIIVIANLSDVKSWLEKAIETGLPKFSPACQDEEESKKGWQQILEKDVLEPCSRLIADGGPDYDGTMCNPETLVRVISGSEQDVDKYHKVVPKGDNECTTMFVGLYSHGSDRPNYKPDRGQEIHSTVPCDLCPERTPHPTGEEFFNGHPHMSMQTRLWYMHFPHPSQSADFVLDDLKVEHPHPDTLLHFQQIFEAYKTMYAHAPNRRVIALNQFCFAGGFNKFLREPYRSSPEFGIAQKWPFYSLSACSEAQTSIVGLFQNFIDHLETAVGDVRSCRLKQRAETTFGDLIQSIKDQYFLENPVKRQSISLSNPCVRCFEFNGREEWENRCSSCYKKFQNGEEQKEEEEKVQQLQGSAQNGFSVAPGFAIPEDVWGDESILNLSLDELFS